MDAPEPVPLPALPRAVPELDASRPRRIAKLVRTWKQETENQEKKP